MADPAEWGDDGLVVAWFKAAWAGFKYGEPTLPRTPFALGAHMTITDPAKFYEALASDIRQGPKSARARYGALQKDLRELHFLVTEEE